MSLIARADYHRNGKIYYAIDNLVWQPSYDTVDAQVGLQGERWTFTVWGKNILEEHFVTSAYSRMISPLIFGVLQVDPIQIDPGAVYGAEFRWKF